MRNTILCIGHPENPHVLEVEKYVKLLDKEAKWVVFQPDFDGHFIEITAGNVSGFTSNCVFVVNGERIPAESITSVWDYLKPWNTPENQDLQGKSLTKCWNFYTDICECWFSMQSPRFLFV